MSKTKEEVFAWLRENESGTAKVIASVVGISVHHASKILSNWKERGEVFIIMRDEKGSLHYSLTPPDRDIADSLKTLRERVCEFLFDNPAKTSSEISNALGMHTRSLRPIIESEFRKNKLKRELCDGVWCYRIIDAEEETNEQDSADKDAVSPELEALVAKAKELESKNLWRRAVTVWDMALKCNQSQSSEKRIRKLFEHANEQALAKTKHYSWTEL